MKLGTTLFVLISLFAFARSAKAATTDIDTLLTLNSQPGDFVGQGLTQTFTPKDGTFIVGTSPGGEVQVFFHTSDFSSFWELFFAPPRGQTLFREQYEGAQRAVVGAPTRSGIDVSGDGRGCNTITGRFLVSEISFALDGTVLKLSIDFEQHCEGAAPALFGSVRFNSDVPVAPQVSVGNASALKGNVGTSDAHVIVSLSMPSSHGVSVNFSTLNESALAGKDYVASSGKVTFPVGTTAQEITIPIIGDRLPRGNKTFLVSLSAANGAPFGDATANVRILDPNVPLTVLSMFGQPGDFISPGQLLVTTADGIFTPLRNPDQGVRIFVNDGNLKILDFTGPTNQTLTPGDYENAQDNPLRPPGTPGLSFVGGTGRGCDALTTGRFTVLQASYAANGDVSKFAADFEDHCEGIVPALFGSIRINSHLRQLSVSNAVIERKKSTATFTVTLNPPAENTVFVEFATADGTAIAGGDYIATTKTIMFAPGQSQHKVEVPLVADTENAFGRQFFGELSAPSGAPIWISQGSATLKPDDDQ